MVTNRAHYPGSGDGVRWSVPGHAGHPATIPGHGYAWHHQQIEAGQEWEQETPSHIDSAQIILLLVSSSFLASDQLYENELMRAMERQAAGAARVVPIILRYVDLEQTPFKKLLALPRNGKPIDSWRNTDEIWTSITREIRQLCEQLRNR